jgi:hypothetical protein
LVDGVVVAEGRAGEVKVGAALVSVIASMDPDAGGVGPDVAGRARLPPEDEDEEEDGVGRASSAGGCTGISGGPATGAAGVSATVGEPGSCEAWPVPVCVVVARAASSPSHVQFHTQVQPERVGAAGAVMQAPVQFHTQVQVSGTPEPLEGSA